MLECPAYDHIRDRHAVLFEFPANMSAAACMQKLFGGNKQRRLARCVFEMDVYRRHLLGKGVLFGVRPYLQPEDYVPNLPYPRCLRQDGYVGQVDAWHAWIARQARSDTVGIVLAALIVAVLLTLGGNVLAGLRIFITSMS